MTRTNRIASLALAPFAAAALFAFSAPASAGHWKGYHGAGYGHPYCYGQRMAHPWVGMHGAYAGKPGYAHGYRYMSAKGEGAHGKAAQGGYGPPAAAPAAAKQDILGVATSAGSFTTLAKAIEAAGLTDTLRGKGPFTVFAPTDEAFAKLPKEKLDALLADREKLTAVLKYHVVAGRMTAAELLEKGKAATAQGQSVSVAALDVVKADVPASNGIIHVIDAVLLPTL